MNLENNFKIAIIGAGPAGLMAAQTISEAGLCVDVFDSMPSAGRKFLLAGKGGLNITHSEPFGKFASRYCPLSDSDNKTVSKWISDFGAQDICKWAAGLGIETFTGTSGKIFPKDMKAAPLLRAWLARLKKPQNPTIPAVKFHMRWELIDIDNKKLIFNTPQGVQELEFDALVFATGGGSWAKLGSNGAWTKIIEKLGVKIRELRAANCGFEINWSEFFKEKFAGQPLKNVELKIQSAGKEFKQRGECVITNYGIEGQLIYAASAWISNQIQTAGKAEIELNLLPNKNKEEIQKEVSHPRGKKSWTSHLKSRLNLQAVHSALLYELLPQDKWTAENIAYTLQNAKIIINKARPIDEAISTTGGVAMSDLGEKLNLLKKPNIFCAGEMIDWDAPTGGYLLTASLASGRRAGSGIVDFFKKD